MRFWLSTLCLVAASLLTGCDSGKAFEPLASDATILAFGDSLTKGKGAAKNFSYPSVLGELSGLQVVNEGVSGELSAAGVARLPSILQTVEPEMLVLMHGGNDILQNRSSSDLKKNLSQMISMAKEVGIEVLLVCLPEKTLFSSCSDIYHDLSDEHDVPLVKDIVAKLIKQPSMKSDTVHFNEAGYRALAERIFTTLKDAGAL